MHAANKVFNNTMFLYIRMAITVFSSLYATRLILNALGANDFGIFTLVGGLISMLVFLNSAMAAASQRFMSYAKGKEDLKEEKSVFNISVLLHIGIALLLTVVLELLGPYFFNHLLNIDADRIDTAKMIYQFMIFSTFFTILSVPYDAVINANENMLFVAVLGVLESLLKLGIAFYITQISGDKLIVFGYLTALLAVIVMVIKSLYAHQKYAEVEINIKKYFDKTLFDKMTSFAGYSFLGMSTQMISNYGQGIILNIFFGTIINAAQGIVAQVSGQLGAFARTMLTALNPMITKSEGAGNRELMLKATFAGSRISFFLLIFFYIPVLFEMPLIFKLWLVNVPEYTIVFCTLLLIRNLIEQLYVTLSDSISSVGNIKSFQISNSILNLLPLPLSYFLFSLGYPPYALYIIFIFYTLLQGSTYLYYANKECGMSLKSYFNDVIAKVSIPFVFISAIVAIPHFLIESDLERFLSVLIVHTFAFILSVWIFGLYQYEKQFILNKLHLVQRS
jgi:Na+-driven multidrug efflux pump